MCLLRHYHVNDLSSAGMRLECDPVARCLISVDASGIFARKQRKPKTKRGEEEKDYGRECERERVRERDREREARRANNCIVWP